jgi:lysophospholipase L1-like esterase
VKTAPGARTIPVGLIGTLLAVIAGLWFVGPAQARTTAAAPGLTSTTPVTRGSAYVALGDSVSFGYQEPGVVPTPDYHRPASFHGYPEQLGTALHLKVTNLACPGETSASLIDDTAPSLGCETGYRKFFTLHVRYRGAQLAYGLSFLRGHRDVKLVSLMIGANDLFLCQSETTDGCASPAEQRATLAKISHNVRVILSAVRKRAHYGGQIAIVNYYSLDYASALSNAESTELNTALDNAAKPFHVEIANGYGELKAASFRFGESPCLAGLLTQVGSYGKCGIHPSYAGQTLLAKALATAIRL